MFYSALYSEVTFAAITFLTFLFGLSLSESSSSAVGWMIMTLIALALVVSWTCVILQQYKLWKRNKRLKRLKEKREKERAARKAKQEKEGKAALEQLQRNEPLQQKLTSKQSREYTTEIDSDAKDQKDRTEEKDRVLYCLRGNPEKFMMESNNYEKVLK